MKSYTQTIISSIAIITLLFSSCSKDFLEVTPSEPTPEVALSDPEVAPELVNAIYNKFLNFNMSSFPWIGITEIASDNANKGSSPGDTGTYQLDLDQYTFTATSPCFRLLWENHYQTIGRANQALLYLPELDIDEPLKNRLIGEAKFLRALVYFRLVQMFGDIPIIDKVPDVTNEEDINKAFVRQPIAAVYELIAEDLSDAIAFLPLKSEYASRDTGRATRGAAQTLLAKVALYQQNWQSVFDLTQQVINSGEYSLEPNYEDIWKEDFENGVESIFEIQGRGEPPVYGVNNYHVSQGARGQGGWGWGFNEPSQDLVNSYEAGDTREDGTIIFVGEVLYDGRMVPATVENPRYNQKAYVSMDYVSNDKNVRLFRYAEVLLMHAEAANELNNSSTAETMLNTVRTRAGLPDTTAANQQEYRMAIWNERRWELAFEHDRIFDLRRQGRVAEVMLAHGVPFIEGKHELYPIPEDQIAQSGGLLEQNPGY